MERSPRHFEPDLARHFREEAEAARRERRIEALAVAASGPLAAFGAVAEHLRPRDLAAERRSRAAFGFPDGTFPGLGPLPGCGSGGCSGGAARAGADAEYQKKASALFGYDFTAHFEPRSGGRSGRRATGDGPGQRPGGARARRAETPNRRWWDVDGAVEDWLSGGDSRDSSDPCDCYNDRDLTVRDDYSTGEPCPDGPGVVLVSESTWTYNRKTEECEREYSCMSSDPECSCDLMHPPDPADDAQGYIRSQWGTACHNASSGFWVSPDGRMDSAVGAVGTLNGDGDCEWVIFCESGFLVADSTGECPVDEWDWEGTGAQESHTARKEACPDSEADGGTVIFPPGDPFGGGLNKALKTCLTACSAGKQAIRKYCRTVKHPVIRGACWGLELVPKQECKNWCYRWWT